MRCSRHDLAGNAEGLCVVCRRETRGAPRTSRVLVMLGATCALILGAVAIYRIAITPAPSAPVTADVGASPRTANTAPALAPAPRDRTRDLEETHRLQELAATTAAPREAAANPPSRAREENDQQDEHRRQEQAENDLRQALAKVRVIIYTTPWCPSCKGAKAWLRENAVAFEERDIEASSEFARQMDRLNPRGTIPTFDIEGEVHVGFAPRQIRAMRDRAARRKLGR